MLCYPVRVAMLWQWVGNPDSLTKWSPNLAAMGTDITVQEGRPSQDERWMRICQRREPVSLSCTSGLSLEEYMYLLTVAVMGSLMLLHFSHHQEVW